MSLSEATVQNFLNPMRYNDFALQRRKLQESDTANATNALANDKLRAEMAKENALSDAVKNFGPDAAANLQGVAGAGSLKGYTDLSATQNANAKEQREAEQARAKKLEDTKSAYMDKTALIDGPEKMSQWVKGAFNLGLLTFQEASGYANEMSQSPDAWVDLLKRTRNAGIKLKDQQAEALKRDELKGEQDWRATQTDTTRRGQDMTYGASTNNNTNTNLTSRQNNAANILSAQTIAAMPARPTAADNKPAKGFRLGPPDPDTGEPTWVAIKGGPEDQKRLNKVAGTDAVDSMIAGLRDIYTQLDTANAITNPTKGVLANVSAGVRSSDIGQATGKLFGTSSQSLRNTVAQQRPLLLQAIRSATGMSARQMDSNVELKLYLTAATDTSLDVETNKRALDMLEKLFGRLSLDRAGGDDADTAHSDRKRGGAVTTTLPHGGKFIGFEN